MRMFVVKYDCAHAQPTCLNMLTKPPVCISLVFQCLGPRCDLSKAAACVECARLRLLYRRELPKVSVCTSDLGHVRLDDGCPPPPGKPHWHLRLLQAPTTEQPD